MNRRWLANLAPAHAHGAALAALLVLGAMLYLLGVRPAHHALRQAESRGAYLRGEAAAAARRASQLTDTRRHIDELRAALGDGPVGAEPTPEVVQSIADRAEARGLTLESLNVGEPEKQATLLRVPIHLSGTGSFASVVALLAEIEAAFPDVAVDELAVASGHSADASQTFQIDLSRYTAPADGG